MVLVKTPPWSRKALQGITFWIGHRRSLYDHYPLGESAFVAELCNLIFAHLKDQLLRCEVQYTELANGSPLPGFFGRRARADIVVADYPVRKGGDSVPRFIIEVKRGSAPAREINSDLKRLAAIGRVVPDCRTLLFVISEAKRLDRFTTKVGTSIKGPHAIPDYADGHFRVRRTYKAAHAFRNIESAQYALLLEVYPRSVPKTRMS